MRVLTDNETELVTGGVVGAVLGHPAAAAAVGALTGYAAAKIDKWFNGDDDQEDEKDCGDCICNYGSGESGQGGAQAPATPDRSFMGGGGNGPADPMILSGRPHAYEGNSIAA